MKTKKKLLFVTQEMMPYVPASDLAKWGRKLPQVIQEKGREIRTFMPKWGIINERRNQLHEVIRLSGMNLAVDDTDHPLIIKVASITSARIQVYFIDNDEFFTNKQMTFDEEGKEYALNAERACFFALGVLETMKKLCWVPEVIHCQGWMSSFIPLFVKTTYAQEACFNKCKTVYTPSHNEANAPLPENLARIFEYSGVPADKAMEGNVEQTNVQFLNHMGMQWADAISLYSEDQELWEMAKKFEKPLQPFVAEEALGETYSAFYDQVWGENEG